MRQKLRQNSIGRKIKTSSNNKSAIGVSTCRTFKSPAVFLRGNKYISLHVYFGRKKGTGKK
jgi:hypothetical protein